MRGRDAGPPSAPIRVSEEARSRNTDKSGIQQFGPPAQDRNVLRERPSTSGGPSPHFSARREMERRRAKDDLHFTPLPSSARVMNSHTPPMPGALPTPAGTPKSSPPLAQNSSFIRTNTPESMMDGRLAGANVENAEIGMALGSPSRQPNTWQSSPPFESTTRSWSPEEQANALAPSRQKSRRWKLLGGLFSGNKRQCTTAEPQPFYHLQPESIVQTMEARNYVNFADATMLHDKPTEKSVNRSRAYSERKNVLAKPDMRRANTVPVHFDSQGPEREQMITPHITLDGGPVSQQVSNQGGLMLNVDIPSVEMERYSVMFGSVLQKPTAMTSSSLLARRQATLEKLKTVTESLPKEHDLRGSYRRPLPRRASSPQPAKSPAFSLFPNGPSRLHTKHGPPSPVPQQPIIHRRSNTSPAVPSPSFPSYNSRPDYDTQAALLTPAPQHVSASPKLKDHISSQMRQPAREVSKSPSNISTKQLSIEQPSPHERSRQLSDLSVAKTDGSHIVEPMQSKPKAKEQVRQIISSPRDSDAPDSIPGPQFARSRGYSASVTASNPSTTAAVRSASARKNAPMHSPPPTSLFRSHTTSATGSQQIRTPNAALSSHPVSNSMTTENAAENKDDEEEREKKLRTAADISIARQISVSREQSRLIIPIRSPGSKRANSPNALTIGQSASPLSAMAAGIDHSVGGRSGNRREDARRAIKERLAAPAAKPSTPTLVVVGDDSTQETWGGTTTANDRGSAEGESRTFAEHRHRKSERVIVESIGMPD